MYVHMYIYAYMDSCSNALSGLVEDGTHVLGGVHDHDGEVMVKIDLDGIIELGLSSMLQSMIE